MAPMAESSLASALRCETRAQEVNCKIGAGICK